VCDQGQREGSVWGRGERTYENAQTHEEVLPTEIVFGHIAIGLEARISWENYEGGDSGKYRSKREEDGKRGHEVFFVVWQLF